MKFIGISKVSTNKSASITKISKQLKIDVGDHIVFFENDKNEIVVKKVVW